MTHALLVQLAARWLETTRGCSLVLVEFTSAGNETPDAIGWRISEGWSVLVECKTSRGDFFRDQVKPARQDRALSIGQERWYLTPPGLLRHDEIPSEWGLLEAGAKVRTAIRCPAGPQEGSRYRQGTIDKEVQANELHLLLSVYRRKMCAKCSREMFRGAGGDPTSSQLEGSPSRRDGLSETNSS